MNFEDKINAALALQFQFEAKEPKPELKKQAYPLPGEALYQDPNSDGSRKRCENCFMWTKDNKCLIFKKDQRVTKTQICRWHIFGTPREKWEDMGIDPQDTKIAGLEEVGEGTSCDTCEYFHKDMCYAVAPEKGKLPPTPVDPLGCCNRWNKK